MKFRKDINGLRAIAVIAVVLYHFNAIWVPGGFAGVDVFFVISGFLMTAIIMREIDQNRFSLSRFYIARANRIIPALAVLCFVILCLGWFYLLPNDYRSLGKHVGSSMGFFSNILYWNEIGYFDVAAHQKWLLHTWSLSVEWQFYIAYPLILMTMCKFMHLKRMKSTFFILTFLGFLFCIVATYLWPSESFYKLSVRAWEMMIGGLAYFFPFKIKEGKKFFLEWSGVFLILISYVFISQENLWPGYLAFIPVFGTFLVIQAQRENSLLTNNFIFQRLGAWSYSIYLWHWPLVVSMYYFSFDNSFVYFGIALSVLLGFLSYKYVEKRNFRKSFSSPMGYLKYKPLLMVVLIGGMGSTVYLNDGMEIRLPSEVAIAAQEETNKNPHKCMTDQDVYEGLNPCFIGNKNSIKAIIVGDSHADAVTTALAGAFDLNLDGILALTKASCPFIVGIKSTLHENVCLLENKDRIKFLEEKYDGIPVFWVARTGAYFFGQSSTDRSAAHEDKAPTIYFTNIYATPEEDLFSEFKAMLNITVGKVAENHPIYLVLPTPEMRQNVPKTLAKNILLGREKKDISIAYELYAERNNLIRGLLEDVAKSENVNVLDPIPYLCFEGRCIAQYQNRPIYYDDDHMSEYGNKLISPMFSQAMKKHL